MVIKKCFPSLQTNFSAYITKRYASSKIGTRRVFKIYRYGGILDKDGPAMRTYEIDTSKCGRMVLDVMMLIKEIDPTFSFRRSCREGICGSCAICLQGANCLACTAVIPEAKTITIHPIPHMYVQRDLVVDMTHFYEQYNSTRPYLITKPSFKRGQNQLAQSVTDNTKTVGLYECVLCACCSTSCPSYWWNGRRFLGPASLLHAYRWVIDSRDTDTYQRIQDLRDDFKVFRCHTIMNCALACPKGLNPGVAIAKLKRLVSGLDKKPTPELDPFKFSSGGSGGGLDTCVKKYSQKK